MARFATSFDLLSERARAAAKRVGISADNRNPYRSITIRAIEALYAVDEALRIIEAYTEPDTPAVSTQPSAGTGMAATEAPRGLLFHQYEIDEDGTIVTAQIVPPTSQNQPSIEADLSEYITDILDQPDETIRLLCEQTIRNYDPCISCATHFLDLTIDRG